MNKIAILYIDDNLLNLEMFEDNFGEDFAITIHNKPQEALIHARNQQPDLIILDVHMPAMSGVDVFKGLLADELTQSIPVMFYSTDDSDATICEVLELGPNDFLFRTMSVVQVRSRILNTVKRVRTVDNQAKILIHENLKLNTQNFIAEIENNQIALTSIEYKLLFFVLNNKERLVTKDELIEFVWGDSFVASKTINTHMSNLRSKIRDASFKIKINRNNNVSLVKV